MQKLTKGCTASGQHNNNKGSKKEGSVGVVTAGAGAGTGARAPSTGGQGGQSAIAANAAVANICFAQMLS